MMNSMHKKTPSHLNNGSLRRILDNTYRKYNRRSFVRPDPIEVLYDYNEPADREIVAMVAACLAYGRVGQILKNIRWVLQRIEPGPATFLWNNSPRKISARMRGFRHRFADERHITALFCACRYTMRTHGSLEKLFRAGMDNSNRTVLPALDRFAASLCRSADGRCGHLLPSPSSGSACKRLNLFLRWMVRKDSVDPGGFSGVPASKLIVPLDTHLHRLALMLGLTHRKSADMKAAMEITAAFRNINPRDPVRYDFALTRLGINPRADMDDFLLQCKKAGVKHD